jgi:hypothetical protein
MPRLAKTKKKSSGKEAGVDSFEAILSVAVNETTSLNLQQKSQKTATIKSKIAGSKKKVLKQQLPHQRSLPAQRMVQKMPI